MQARFVIVASKGPERSTELRLPVVLGRSEKDAKLRIKSDSVSRKHCEFFLEDDEVFVRDLGSTNGTFVDGARVSATTPAAVRHGGIIRVGTVSLRVEWDSAADGESTDDDTAAIPATAPDATTRDETHAEASEPPAESARPVGDVEPVASTEADAAAGFFGAADVAEPPPDDEKLGDFFKSLT